MKLKIKDSFNKISISDINSFEQEFEFLLPEEYRVFLLKNNGGFPVTVLFKTKSHEYESDLRVLYGLTNNDTFSLKVVNILYKNRIPNDCISIGSDSLGNQILLNRLGEVKFYDHETGDILIIEDSFNNFIKSLYLFEEEDITDFEKAVSRQDLSFFKKKIEAGININDITNEVGRTATQMAAAQNKFKLLQFCVENGGNLDQTVLLSASNNHVKTLKLVLSKGADINERDNLNDDTPLMLACLYGNYEATEILIRAGANVNAKDKYGNNALNKAYRSGNEKLIAFIEASSENSD